MSAPVNLPKWADIVAIPLLNITLAFIISGLVVLAIGEDPIDATRLMITGSLGSINGLGYTLYYATSFIFAGLAVAVAFKAGLFNIGGDGQAYIGGLGAALIGLNFGFLPAIVVIPLAIVVSLAFGALWALIPAYLQAKRGSHIVITTIMFNALASALMSYLLVNVLRKTGSMDPSTQIFAKSSFLPKLKDLLALFGIHAPETPLNLSLILALVTAYLVWLLIWRTRLGYEIRTVGANPHAAKYGGMSPARITIITMLISGALSAGLASNMLLGDAHRVQLDYTAGFGFVGIAVALMGRAHPVGIILASVLFGMLYQGGAELAFDKPKITRDMIMMIQGLVVLFGGALEGLFRKPLADLLARFSKGAR